MVGHQMKKIMHKGTINKIKPEPTEWQKIFADHIQMRCLYPQY